MSSNQDKGMSEKKQFAATYTRIVNFLKIIHIALYDFDMDNHYYPSNDLVFIKNIEKGIEQLNDLLAQLKIEQEKQINNKVLFTKLHHDMRLAINLIQGYAEMLLDVLQSELEPIGGNFDCIINAAKEILKNVDLLFKDKS